MGRGRKSLKFGASFALGSLFATQAFAQNNPEILPPIDVWSTRIGGTGITGASTSVITSEDIARSPHESLQDLIGREAGVQTTSLFGGVNGAQTTVDMRGFGATAASNTLVLINGRRLTDIDLAGVDFSSIPRQSVERIEITRGNSGAVLYGDGAVGGVINIITKTGIGLPPTARIEGGFGSFNQREGNISAAASSGPFAVSTHGSAIDSDGYRQNNALRQRDGVGDIRYTTPEGSVYFNLSADDQHLGLPGGRLVTLTTSQLVTKRTGAATPTAFGDKQGVNATLGVTRNFGNGVELILDGGVRQKKQQAFSEIAGFAISDDRQLTTTSFTPRLVANNFVMGMPSKFIGGVDFYYAKLGDNRGDALSDPPIHHYDLSQRTLALYAQETLGILPTTDVSFGARLQNMHITATDRFDPTAPGAFPGFDAQGLPLDRTETQHALHLGFEHRFGPALAAFGRVAHSFRTPNVDERVGVFAFPVDFNLKTQTSNDAEIGLRLRAGPLEMQSSVYYMTLDNEIMFIPFPPIGANINLDPTRRVGWENTANLHLAENFRIKGALTYTDARFREGPFAGNQVPLVSQWTGNIGASWDIYQKLVVLDVVARFIGARRMDNDQANFQPMIPAHTLVDLRVGGEVKNFFWSFAIQNLFNLDYFDYAVASSATFGTYNAYPQPGRTYMVRAGARF